MIGVPLDFRLGFGAAIGEDATLVQLDFAPSKLDKTRLPDLAPRRRHRHDADGDPRIGPRATPSAPPPGSRSSAGSRPRSEPEEQEMLDDDRSPLHPMRVYKELGDFLDRDAIVVGDGGDFVSFAGRVWETWEPGTWMDPRPIRLPRRRPGPGDRCQARSPRAPGLSPARRRRLRLLRDGVRHDGPPQPADRRRDGQQRHLGARAPPDEVPLRLLARRRAPPETRYDEVVSALGCHGELVRSPDELRPALERAFASGKPALVNVITDPEVVYPRRANLA